MGSQQKGTAGERSGMCSGLSRARRPGGAVMSKHAGRDPLRQEQSTRPQSTGSVAVYGRGEVADTEDPLPGVPDIGDFSGRVGGALPGGEGRRLIEAVMVEGTCRD